VLKHTLALSLFQPTVEAISANVKHPNYLALFLSPVNGSDSFFSQVMAIGAGS
jgi:hypothetical protein